MSAYTGNTSGPVASSTVRAPRVRILMNGNAMHGVESINVTLTNNFEAARFRIEANVEPSYAMNAAWWSNQAKVSAQIQMGYQTASGSGSAISWQTVLSGVVDAYELDFDGRGITIDGRDLAAHLIDTKTAETYSNQTSSEIATALAQSAGLSITDASGNSTIQATTTPVGRYYQIDHARMSLGQFHTDITQWDLLIYLAQQEGFDLFVSGTALYFQPAATAANAYNISWQLGSDGIPVSNVSGLRGSHSLTLAKGVSVTVKSWHSGLKRPIIAKTADPTYSEKSGDGTQDYVFYIPNLTPQQAIARANATYADITRHLRRISFEAPGDLVLTPRLVVILTGTGTAFDTTYYPDTIEMSLSMSEGFDMSVSCKNIPPTPTQLI